VVGFEVEPKSIDSKRITVENDGSCAIQTGQDMQKIDSKGWRNSYDFIEIQYLFLGENKIIMSYEVEWTPSETRWASRYVLNVVVF
jgi:hypothetical protein